MPIRSDVDQILLSEFTNTTSDSRIFDQLLMFKGPGSLSGTFSRPIIEDLLHYFWLDFKNQLRRFKKLNITFYWHLTLHYSVKKISSLCITKRLLLSTLKKIITMTKRCTFAWSSSGLRNRGRCCSPFVTESVVKKALNLHKYCCG